MSLPQGARDAVADLMRSAGLMVKTFASGEEFLTAARREPPSCLVLDVKLPGVSGLDVQEELAKSDVRVPQGYLLKNTLHSDLLQTIRAVHAGKRSLSPEVSFQVAQHVSDQTLTPAEVVVLRLIAAGNANKQIADQLAIAEDTVKGRVKSILAKLDANDRTHAAIIGLKRGIIEL
jgi:DNA-binding NarL/FixJ family response regulator